MARVASHGNSRGKRIFFQQPGKRETVVASAIVRARDGSMHSLEVGWLARSLG